MTENEFVPIEIILAIISNIKVCRLVCIYWNELIIGESKLITYVSITNFIGNYIFPIYLYCKNCYEFRNLQSFLDSNQLEGLITYNIRDTFGGWNDILRLLQYNKTLKHIIIDRMFCWEDETDKIHLLSTLTLHTLGFCINPNPLENEINFMKGCIISQALSIRVLYINFQMLTNVHAYISFFSEFVNCPSLETVVIFVSIKTSQLYEFCKLWNKMERSYTGYLIDTSEYSGSKYSKSNDLQWCHMKHIMSNTCNRDPIFKDILNIPLDKLLIELQTKEVLEKENIGQEYVSFFGSSDSI